MVHPSFHEAKGSKHVMVGLYVLGAIAYWYTGGPFVLLGLSDDTVKFKPFEQKIRQFLYEYDPRYVIS